MTKRTPGPWKVSNDGAPSWWGVYSPSTNDDIVTGLTNEADARLIAAAPKLLEALKELLARRGMRVRRNAIAAIAAAEGD